MQVESALQDNNTKYLSPSAERQAYKVLHEHGIAPNSARGEECLRLATKNADKNPVGYIVNALRKNPDFGLAEAVNNDERYNRPISSQEFFEKLKNGGG